MYCVAADGGADLWSFSRKKDRTSSSGQARVDIHEELDYMVYWRHYVLLEVESALKNRLPSWLPH